MVHRSGVFWTDGQGRHRRRERRWRPKRGAGAEHLGLFRPIEVHNRRIRSCSATTVWRGGMLKARACTGPIKPDSLTRPASMLWRRIPASGSSLRLEFISTAQIGSRLQFLPQPGPELRQLEQIQICVVGMSATRRMCPRRVSDKGVLDSFVYRNAQTPRDHLSAWAAPRQVVDVATTRPQGVIERHRVGTFAISISSSSSPPRPQTCSMVPGVPTMKRGCRAPH